GREEDASDTVVRIDMEELHVLCAERVSKLGEPSPPFAGLERACRGGGKKRLRIGERLLPRGNRAAKGRRPVGLLPAPQREQIVESYDRASVFGVDQPARRGREPITRRTCEYEVAGFRVDQHKLDALK